MKIATAVGLSAQGSVPATPWPDAVSECTHPHTHLEPLLSFASFSKSIPLTKSFVGRDGGEGTTSCMSVSSPHTGMRSEREHE